MSRWMICAGIMVAMASLNSHSLANDDDDPKQTLAAKPRHRTRLRFVNLDQSVTVGDSLILTTKLVTTDGKLLKNKEIRFFVNGSQVGSAQTIDGIAQFELSILVMGDFEVQAVFDGDNRNRGNKTRLRHIHVEPRMVSFNVVCALFAVGRDPNGQIVSSWQPVLRAFDVATGAPIDGLEVSVTLEDFRPSSCPSVSRTVTSDYCGDLDVRLPVFGCPNNPQFAKLKFALASDQPTYALADPSMEIELDRAVRCECAQRRHCATIKAGAPTCGD